MRYATYETLYEAISEIHNQLEHAGRDLMYNKVKKVYANISKLHVQAFVDSCQKCQLKKSRIRKSIVVKPIISKNYNSRAQVDCIDLQSQPDGDYKYVLVYQVKVIFLFELNKNH